jgi:hypothetical protein
MAGVIPGRMTADVEGDFVVFLIGMRINKPWKLHKWIPVAMAMGPMLRVLSTRKDLGLLGYTTWISPTGVMLVQYWRSVADLNRFASDPSLPHRPAWRRFNRKVGAGGDVGIWHETFEVSDGRFETIYGNMPRFGLAQAGEHLPVARRGHSAAERLGRGAAERLGRGASVAVDSAA